MSILNEIFAYKREEVAAKSNDLPLEALKERLLSGAKKLSFIQALTRPTSLRPALIAEVKHKSPSKGVLRENFDPLKLAHIYCENGAAAISVLTDEKYFGGKLEYLEQIHQALSKLPHPIPALRKDFIFSEYQIAEAATAGASAVLLIASMLSIIELAFLIEKTEEYGMTPFVETHNRSEIETAIAVGANVIGVNNRDLHTFTVDLDTSLKLRDHIPPSKIMVSESGIKSAEDVNKLAEAGIDAMLVGETLVREPDPGVALRRLRGEV